MSNPRNAYITLFAQSKVARLDSSRQAADNTYRNRIGYDAGYELAYKIIDCDDSQRDALITEIGSSYSPVRVICAAYHLDTLAAANKRDAIIYQNYFAPEKAKELETKADLYSSWSQKLESLYENIHLNNNMPTQMRQ